MFPARLSILMVLLFAGDGAWGQHVSVEGPVEVRVLDIGITGARITRDRIILREMLVRAGDTLSSKVLYEKLERSRQNLVNTGLFNTVAVTPLYIDPGTVIIEVAVNERWYIWPAPIFELADPNFNTWWLTKDLSRANYGMYLYNYNFRGRNETVYAMAQLGYTQQFALHYQVPFFDKKQRWGISMGGSLMQQAEVTAATVDNVRILLANPDGPNRIERRADIRLDLRRRHDVRHRMRFGFVQAEVSDTVVQVARDYFDGSSTNTRYLSLGYTFILDRRDVRFFPREGHLTEIHVDRYGLGPLDRASPDLTTVLASTIRWWKVQEKVTLAMSLRGKRSFGAPPYFLQEGLGYGRYVRGYEYYVIDGEHSLLWKGNFIFQLFAPREYRLEALPLEAFRTLYFAMYLDLFADVGRVWDSRFADRNFLANEWMGGYGIGLNLVSSYDQVVRAEYSLNALGEHGFFLHFTQPF